MSGIQPLSTQTVAQESRSDAPDAAHLRLALNGLAIGLLTFDRRLRVMFANDRIAELLDASSAALQHCTTLIGLFDICAALDSGTAATLHEACLATVTQSGRQFHSLTITTAASNRDFLVQINKIGEGQWMASFDEVTHRRAAEANALETAMRDTLTGLPTRLVFQNRLATVCSADEALHPQPGLVMLVDLDRFKAVNDTLGHPVGDGLLRLVAKRFGSVLGPDDTVARLGGDEFGILIPSPTDEDGATKLAKRIVDVIGRPYLVDGHQINIGASVGVAWIGKDGRDYDHLVRCADLALYDAKSSGRSTFSFFNAEMDVRAMARRTLEIDLRRALALRQFELHYQPQIDLDGNRLVGFEALIRWRHPERGLVMPLDFIPLAEEIGLILGLGDWVLREACQQASKWPDDVSVAVNVSPRQFEDGTRLVGAVAKALAASGLPGRRLEIEITESVLLRNEAEVLSTLHRIRDLGVRVAMDDFGTGYSSLSQLHSFPFDKIKIDRSFVNVGGSEDQSAIVRAITALGVSLGMATIAEGVETEDQLATMRNEGCTSVQGYLFSKPVPVDQIDQLIGDLTAGRARLLDSNEGE